MMKPAGSPGAYRPRAWPTKPPSRAPTMPSTIVTMMPPGSRPGINSLAIAPTIKPKTIQPRMPIAHLPHYEGGYCPHAIATEQAACREKSEARHSVGERAFPFCAFAFLYRKRRALDRLVVADV